MSVWAQMLTKQPRSTLHALDHVHEGLDMLLYLYNKYIHAVSGVAKLGHTGAHAPATRGCAPPVQALPKIIVVKCTVINRKLGAKST